MSDDHEFSHHEASQLLPWLLNGSLSGDERDAVQAHLRRCISCRRDLEQQKTLQRAFAAGSADALAREPTAAGRRAGALTRRHARGAVAAAVPRYPAPARRDSWLLKTLQALTARPLRSAAIALAFLTVGVAGALTVALLPRQDPAFVTLTEPEQLPAGRYLRIVLHPDAGPDSAARLARRAGLFIADGPTGRGVYTLASDSTDEPFWHTARSTLEQEADVLFVQGIVVGHGP